MKLLKRIFSLIIAILIQVPYTSLVTATDDEASECNCGHNPVAIVSGMHSSPLFKDDTRVFGMTASAYAKMISGVVGPLKKVFKDNKWDDFCDNANQYLYEFLEPVSFNSDGTSKYNITTITYPRSYDYYLNNELYRSGRAFAADIAEAVGGDHTFCYVYDWRQSPLINADGLSQYIQNVKKLTGHQKVSLVGVSMGGTVTLSYLYKYGYNDISNITMVSSAFTGTHIVGDLLSGKVEIDKDAVIRFIKQLFVNFESLEKPVQSLIKKLNSIGFFDYIIPFMQGYFVESYNRLFDEILKPVFAYMPGVWGLIASEEYENCKDFVLGDNGNESFEKLVDEYHYNVQLNGQNLLQRAKDLGIPVAVVSNYNSQGMPVIKHSGDHNDTIIDTAHSSGGATVADIDKSFGGSYNQVINDGHNHISCDRAIDASTCMFPESTWFIKNLQHIRYPVYGNTNDFIVWLVTADKQYSVFDNKKYPQFLYYDTENHNLIPLVEGSLVK